MFGLFKKKEAPRPAASVNENVVEKAAGLLNLQLLLCRSQPNYLTGLDSHLVRGYLIGFFDCAVQKLGQPVRGDEDFAMLLLHGHARLLGGDLGNTQTYTFASLRLQDDPQFALGQADGGNDCDNLLTGKSSRALTLLSYFTEG